MGLGVPAASFQVTSCPCEMQGNSIILTLNNILACFTVKQTHHNIVFNTCDFGVTWNLRINPKLVQVLQLLIYAGLISVGTLAQLWTLCTILEM